MHDTRSVYVNSIHMFVWISASPAWQSQVKLTPWEDKMPLSHSHSITEKGSPGPALPSSGGSCGQWPVMPSEASIGDGDTSGHQWESPMSPTQSVIIIVGRVSALSALSGVTLPAMTHDHVNTQHLSKCLILTQWEMIRATKWQHTTSLGQLRKLNIALWQLNKYLSHLPWYSCVYLNTGRTDAWLFMFLYSENPDA